MGKKRHLAAPRPDALAEHRPAAPGVDVSIASRVQSVSYGRVIDMISIMRNQRARR